MDLYYQSSLMGIFCVQCPTKAMTFQQMIMHVLQYPHDVDVYLLFCFDLDFQLTCSQGHV